MYKVFFGYFYYPKGGYEDFKGSFESLDLAKKFILETRKNESFSWAHIVLEDKIVLKGTIIDEYPKLWRWDREIEKTSKAGL